MKKIFLVLVLNCILFAQSVPVTIHFRPPIKTFTTLRLVGSFNGWNNADPAMVMKDSDGDGEYTITVSLAAGTDHLYKFCMDANWSYAYNDPDNPRIKTSDNDNSMMLVKDPLISYLLPKGIDSKNKEFVDTTKAGSPIRVIYAFTAANPIDQSKIGLTIDGVAVPNPSQYYDTAKKELLYVPNPPLAIGEHVVVATVASAAGADTVTSKFLRNPNLVVYKTPVDFYYDANNKTVAFAQTLTAVSLMGPFNNWNDAFNPMKNSNGNGVWETTLMLPADSVDYKFKLNHSDWENDPDWAATNSLSGNNLIIVKVDSLSSIKLLSPLENLTFKKDTTVNFKILLRPGGKSTGIDATSIKLLYDGNTATNTYNAADSTVSAAIAFTGEGRHTVDISFKNKEGILAQQVYSYSIFSAPKGVYVVDGIGDEQYTYPAGVIAGAADILSVEIQETDKHDSLKFSIKMKDIDDRTRLGFLINNPVTAFISDPRQLEIKLPDWNGQGVFASIGVPGNSYQNAQIENRFQITNSPATYSSDSIYVNSNAKTSKTFEFTVSLAFLTKHMGGWTQERQFSVFSYLAAEDKSGNGYEVTAANGGSSAFEDPDVYDAAFIRSNMWQKRILNNYIPSGTRMAVLDGTGRGLLTLTAGQISDSLATKETYVTFLTPGVTYWYSNVTVQGLLSDSSIKHISFVFNGTATPYDVSNAKFAIPVVLKEGANTVVIKITDSNNVVTTSKELVMTYAPDKRPAVTLSGTVSSRDVTLTATASSPINEALMYEWFGETSNPASVVLASTTNTVTFALPKVDGQYIFGVNVSTPTDNSAYAKLVVKAVGDVITVYGPEDNYHAAWVDSAIVYEIYPRSFSAQGGFQGITANIARIKSLGANTVWLMPVFEGPSIHGYEITNYYALESDYGTNADFVNMISAFKKNGLRVILDQVVNHTALSHPFMQNVYKNKEYSPWANFYIWSGEPGNSSYAYYFDWTSLPNLNHNNADVRKYFIDASKYWVENYQIDGYRCDVAWGVEERNKQFWPDWRKALHSLNPEVYLLAEANSSDSTFYQKRFDSAYDWDLRNLMINVLNGSNTLGDLHKQAVRTNPTYARPFRFVENHDETRATSMFDTKRSLLEHTIMFTLNGIPLIYSGGEVGESTQRNPINWTDADNLRPYFIRLVKIRKDYIFNPVISRVQNTDTAKVYSYASISGTKTILTVANFKNSSLTVNLDLSKLPYDGSSTYYLTDLFGGKVYPVKPADRTACPVILSNYQARVFYYGIDSVIVATPVKVDDSKNDARPKEMALFQNYPNPFNPVTVIKYQISQPGRVSLKVYDILGKEVMTLVDGFTEAGTFNATFNATNLSSGIYIYQLRAGNFVASKKIILLK